MNIVEELQAYKVQVNSEITTQTDPESISPPIVGDMGTSLADILLAFLPKQNKFVVGAGSANPTGGADTDLYFKGKNDGIDIFRKVGADWTLLATIPLGFSFPNGILSGLRTSILQQIVTVTPGAWSYLNAIYSKNTQTQFTLAAKDPSFDRFDLIHATNTNQVQIITGVATLVPVRPALPAGSVLVDYAYVPATGSPFLLSGQTIVATTPEPIEVTEAMQTDGLYTLPWNEIRINSFGKYGRFAVEQADSYQEVSIRIIKNLSTGAPEAYEFNLSGLPALIHIL